VRFYDCKPISYNRKDRSYQDGSYVSMPQIPLSKYVGQRLRARRIELGLSQTIVGEGLGITFQQLQKNEWGINRIGASRLFELSKILDVPISYFFEGLPLTVRQEMRATINMDESNGIALDDQEVLKVVRTYYRIGDAKLRSALLELCKHLGRREA
jgi:transcriptional regulator with XRE-family HTH domain